MISKKWDRWTMSWTDAPFDELEVRKNLRPPVISNLHLSVLTTRNPPPVVLIKTELCICPRFTQWWHTIIVLTWTVRLIILFFSYQHKKMKIKKCIDFLKEYRRFQKLSLVEEWTWQIAEPQSQGCPSFSKREKKINLSTPWSYDSLWF